MISNTERFNKAIGLPAVNYSTELAPGGVKRFGLFKKLGIVAGWEEHPFEWIEGRRMGILREYNRGVLKWMTSVVELDPNEGGGTRLTHTIRVVPTGRFGRLAVSIEIGFKARRAIDRVYRRIDAALAGRLGDPISIDPYEPVSQLPVSRQRRLYDLIEQLSRFRLDSRVVSRLGKFLAEAPSQDVARIRPLDFARRFNLDPDQMTEACLHGARLGLLVLLWDILCPRCRISSSIQDTIRAIRDHGHCTACNADFELDFANSVEMVFRVHPQIREAETGIYCAGGPAHSPHVVAQVRVAAGERFELALTLAEGDFQLRGPQLPYAIDFRVQPGVRKTRWEIDLSQGPNKDFQGKLGVGHQHLMLHNPCEHEIVVRIERSFSTNALTAARATAIPLFREIFPGEVLSPGQLISVTTMALVATELADSEVLYRQLGDVRAVAIVHEQFRLLEDFCRREGGALVKTVHNGMLLAFHDAAAALRAALRLHEQLLANESTRDLHLKVAVHRGTTIAATLHQNLDYFGQTVNDVLQLVQQAHAGEVLMTQAMVSDPQVATLLETCSVDVVAMDDPALAASLLIAMSVRLKEPSSSVRRSAQRDSAQAMSSTAE